MPSNINQKIYWSNRSVWKLFVLDINIWYYISLCKLFFLRIVTWDYNCLLRIIIISYLKPYNCANRSLLSNRNSYLKQHNCVYRLMAWETRVPSQIKSYQRLEKWYLITLCLTLEIIRYVSKVKWNNPGKGVAPSFSPWCCSYRKMSLQVTNFTY